MCTFYMPNKMDSTSLGSSFLEFSWEQMEIWSLLLLMPVALCPHLPPLTTPIPRLGLWNRFLDCGSSWNLDEFYSTHLNICSIRRWRMNSWHVQLSSIEGIICSFTKLLYTLWLLVFCLGGVSTLHVTSPIIENYSTIKPQDDTTW